MQQQQPQPDIIIPVAQRPLGPGMLSQIIYRIAFDLLFEYKKPNLALAFPMESPLYAMAVTGLRKVMEEELRTVPFILENKLREQFGNGPINFNAKNAAYYHDKTMELMCLLIDKYYSPLV